MTREEAQWMAKRVFGLRGAVSDGLQMKDSLEDAVGVGFIEGRNLCIQGKGVNWEAAFAQAESRRDQWEHRVRSVQKDLQDTVGAMAIKAMKDRIQEIEDVEFMSDEDRLIHRLKGKIQKKWGK